jgi:hypothetical protein
MNRVLEADLEDSAHFQHSETPARRGELYAELGQARANATTSHQGMGRLIPINPSGPMRQCPPRCLWIGPRAVDRFILTDTRSR